MGTDFLFDETGDIPLYATLATGDAVTVQRVRRRLKTFRGEWMLNKRTGLPFIEWGQQKPPDVNGQGALVLIELTTTPGVELVEEFEATFDQANRRVLFTARIVLESGTVATLEFAPVLGGNSLPFVAILFPSGTVIP